MKFNGQTVAGRHFKNALQGSPLAFNRPDIQLSPGGEQAAGAFFEPLYQSPEVLGEQQLRGFLVAVRVCRSV
ncbi:MAG: hypothetical protein GEU28_07010 [Dehalococcoidia bacterium]|nr:hypothetical protein [Dehalococcoidia bacterium]